MKCLIIGGTGFLGSAIANAIAAAGHNTYIVSRSASQHKPNTGIKTIIADRNKDLSSLKQHEFDWVFDTCAYTPNMVNRLLDALSPNLKHYVIISSISAYDDFSTQGINEESIVPTASAEDLKFGDTVNHLTAAAFGASYGKLKRASEIAATERLGKRATSLRVGLLIGAGDYSDRLTWWARRIDQAHGEKNKIIAPAPSSRKIQLIDVLDVAQFALNCAENQLAGIWNVTSPAMDFSLVLNKLIDISKSKADIIWTDEKRILDAGIKPWSDLPLMVPTVPEYKYFMQIDTSRAVSAGLTCRPIDQTLKSILMWDRGRRDTNLICGLTTAQEASLMA